MMTGWEAYLPFRSEFTALCPEKYPPEYIDAMVASGQWACWSDGKAAILFELKRYPSGLLEVYGWGAVGELESIKTLVEAAEVFGTQNGATAAEIESRPGWVKALAGYEVTQVKIRKELR